MKRYIFSQRIEVYAVNEEQARALIIEGAVELHEPILENVVDVASSRKNDVPWSVPVLDGTADDGVVDA